MSRKDKDIYWQVEAEPVSDGTMKYRAELWRRPYGGDLLAMTPYRPRKSDATRDGRRVFRLFTESR